MWIAAFQTRRGAPTAHEVTWDTRAMEMPDVHYAQSGDVSIAYQVIGEGPLDVVLVPDWVSNLVWGWQSARWRAFYERLASFSRLILFDKCGTGLSDRPRWLTVEAQMDDIRAVIDAADSERASLLGAVQGSRLWALFAATYPERRRGAPPVSPARIPADSGRRLCDLPTTRVLVITC